MPSIIIPKPVISVPYFAVLAKLRIYTTQDCELIPDKKFTRVFCTGVLNICDQILLKGTLLVKGGEIFMTDEKIIELYFNRDEQAIRETQIKYGNLCFKVAMNILNVPEDAEETVNDTYLGAWNSIPPQRPNVFSAFLIKITRKPLDLFRAVF